jgi:EAL domain-containing protein (putative c-di-GMP-specific phosphodiesterase class I)
VNATTRLKNTVTTSSGITVFPDDGAQVDSLIKNAEMALMRAKNEGRNNFQFFTEELEMRASRRVQMEGQLRKGLENSEFVLHYQPQIDLASGKIIGMEALVRWQRPNIGLVSPLEFIPIAEETGLICQLGEWVLRTACQQTKEWIDAGFGSLRISVNLSARQFMKKDLAKKVEEILTNTSLPPNLLEIEVTESMVMENVDSAIATLEGFKEKGIRISIDDFGTGYSSLSYLKKFPIHTLKIDKSFVRDLTVDSDDSAIVKAIISLAHNLNLHVIAEGAEIEDQVNFLRKMKCDTVQGYFYSPVFFSLVVAFTYQFFAKNQPLTFVN